VQKASLKTAFLTIATQSHVAHAAVLLESIHNTPPPDLFVALVDQSVDATAELSWCQVIDARTCLPAEEWQFIVERYTAPEVCFALKPRLIAHLLAQGFEQVHYVDSDIVFYDRPQPLVEALASADVSLTPHYLHPPEEDGKSPNALTLLQAGVFNAGYVGVRNTPEGRRFASWWAAIVARYGQLNPKAGMSGDQRWLDLVPALFPGAQILRTPGANVGYWNLHERTLRQERGRYMVGESPLLFFHFSGFDPERAGQLSRYQDRFDVGENDALLRLTTEYAAALSRADYHKWSRLKYRHHRWWHGDSYVARKFRRYAR
jgi:hypothetical protein